MHARLSHRWNLSFPAAARLQARLRGLLRHTPPRRAVRPVMACCRGHRLPEPVRQAHPQVTRLRKVAA